MKKYDELKSWLNNQFKVLLEYDIHKSVRDAMKDYSSKEEKRIVDDLLTQKIRGLENMYARQSAENERLVKINEMLIGCLCDKYNAGSVILYDEHNPRIVKVIHNGVSENMENAKSLYFNWYKGEFPEIEIAR